MGRPRRNGRHILERDLGTQRHGVEILSQAAVGGNWWRGRGAIEPAYLDILRLEREFKGAVGIPVEAQSADALIAAAHTAGGQGRARRALIVVEVEIAVARRQFKSTPTTAAGREVDARTRIGEGAVGG